MQWMMLQQDKPEDFIISTGTQHSVREFITWSAAELGINLRFEGDGINEIGIIESLSSSNDHAVSIGDTIVRIDPRYFRPAEVETLLGDPSKAKSKLGWEPTISVQEMCKEMIAIDLNIAKKYKFLKDNGFEDSVDENTD
jgi:GDPmannose 4,6-dehydratase